MTFEDFFIEQPTTAFTIAFAALMNKHALRRTCWHVPCDSPVGEDMIKAFNKLQECAKDLQEKAHAHLAAALMIQVEILVFA